jgi:predicted sugar kinase
MQIEIAAPACMPLGLVRGESSGVALLGAALRYPAINLTARPSETLMVTGARADHAYASALRFLRHQHWPEQGEIEIELAAPSFMGLGSDVLLALCVAQALAWVHGRPVDNQAAAAAALGLGPEHALFIQASQQGGMLLAAAGRPDNGASVPLRRAALVHADDAAWAFVLVLPRIGPDTPADLEARRLAALLDSGGHLSEQTGRLVEAEVWPALQADELERFGRALSTIQELNRAALRQAGNEIPLTVEEQSILDLFREHGAAASGRSPTGLALFAIIRGATASIALRKALVERVGIYGATVSGSIVDNVGSRHAVQETDPLYTGASPLVTGSRM